MDNHGVVDFNGIQHLSINFRYMGIPTHLFKKKKSIDPIV